MNKLARCAAALALAGGMAAAAPASADGTYVCIEIRQVFVFGQYVPVPTLTIRTVPDGCDIVAGVPIP